MKEWKRMRGTYAVQQPKIPKDQIARYHDNPTTDRARSTPE